jgi:hypothetical protein
MSLKKFTQAVFGFWDAQKTAAVAADLRGRSVAGFWHDISAAGH